MKKTKRITKAKRAKAEKKLWQAVAELHNYVTSENVQAVRKAYDAILALDAEGVKP